MTSLKYSYTTDEEIESFQVHEKMVEVTGFVDATDGFKKINIKGTPSSLFSFVINNCSAHRMRVLIWDDKGKEFAGKVQLRHIMEINAGTMKESNPKFRHPNENIHLLEFNVQRSSVITFYGDHKESEIPPLSYKPTELKDVMYTEEKRIEVMGYIKSILKMETQKSFYGSGVIVKDYYRLCIQVTNYVENSRLQKGVPVKVREEMDKRSGGVLKINYMDDIDILEEAFLSDEDLRLSYRRLVCTKRQKSNEIEAQK